MRTIYEIDDEVVITQNWRDWKIGEIAKVTNTQFEQAPNKLQLITLRNENEHDFHVLYEYMVAPNKAYSGRAGTERL